MNVRDHQNRKLGNICTRLRCIPLLGVAAFGLISTPADAELIQNGSFEFPTTAAGTRLVAVPNSWTGGAWISHPNSAGSIGIGFTWPQAPDGEQYIDIGDIGSLALNTSFMLQGATNLNLSWKDNTALHILPGYQTSPYTVKITDGSSNVVASASFDAYHSNGAWQSRALSQSLAAGNYTLTFSSTGYYGGTNTLIDAVSAVPEPASALLLIIGSVFLVRPTLAKKGNRTRHA